jgi:diphthine synthase
MLYLVGLGIGDEKDLSLRSIEVLKKCDRIYCELFTNNWAGDLKKLEKTIGKKITLLKREEVESDLLIKEAKNRRVALLVPGDPLAATTHMELMIEAKKQNMPVEIVHSSSVYTAVAECGLQLYKFGRTTTLPKMQEKFHPSSPIEIIKDNKKSGLHTLILLDIGMSAKEGLGILAEKFSQENVVACCNLGSKNKTIKYGKVSDLVKDKELDKSPAVLIVPGKLHFKEEEALQLWI